MDRGVVRVMLSGMKGAALLPVLGCIVLAISFASAQPEEQDSDAPDLDAEGPGGPEDAAPDDTKVCLASFTKAQKSRREGRLIEARSALILCSQPACPAEIVSKCTPWLREVKAAVPSIIVVARDANDNDILDARISIDGEEVPTSLRGRPIEIDPGTHRLLVQPPGHADIDLHVVVVQSEKNRVIVAKVAAPPAPPPLIAPPPRPEPEVAPAETSALSGISPWAWVGFGIGAAGLAAGTVTGVIAIDRADDLEATCPGTLCSTSYEADFDEGARFAHASTAMFIVGGAGIALGIAALIWLGDSADDPQLSVGPDHISLGGRF